MFFRAINLLQTAGIALTRFNSNMDAMSVVKNYMHASSAHDLNNVFDHMLY